MKAILEFELPGEQDEFTLATKGSEWFFAMWELKEWLRSRIKYEYLTDEEYELYEGVMDKLFLILEERMINFEEVS